MRVSIYAAANTEGIEAHVFDLDGFGYYVDILDTDAGRWLSEDVGRHSISGLAEAEAYADLCVRVYNAD